MVPHDRLSTLSTELRERRDHAARIAAALVRAETALDALHREQGRIEQRHQRVQTVTATRLVKAHLDDVEAEPDAPTDDTISIELHAVHDRMQAARQAVEIVKAQLRDAQEQVAQTDMQITAEIERMVTERQAQALADQREARRRYIEASDILAQRQPDGLKTPANIKVRISPEVEHALAETRHFVNDLDSTVPALRTHLLLVAFGASVGCLRLPPPLGFFGGGGTRPPCPSNNGVGTATGSPQDSFPALRLCSPPPHTRRVPFTFFFPTLGATIWLGISFVKLSLREPAVQRVTLPSSLATLCMLKPAPLA